MCVSDVLLLDEYLYLIGLMMVFSYCKVFVVLFDYYSVFVVEDCCLYDFIVLGLFVFMLVGEMSDDLVFMIGILLKLFWGGLRIGWLRVSLMCIW